MTVQMRWHQLENWLKNPKLGAEIGVKEGRCISYLLDKFPQLRMYAVDPWIKQPGGAEDYLEWDFNAIYTEYLNRTYINRDRIIELKDFSVNAAEKVPDDSLDFVFIDAQHDYESVRQDILTWLPKVMLGGIIAGHDYDADPSRDFAGVIRAVDEIFGKQYVITGNNVTWMVRV